MLETETSTSKPFERRPIITRDGSSSIEVVGMDETYHSASGALTESKFIFIDHGLNLIPGKNLKVLEIGMGTGLNVLLTIMEAQNRKIDFHTLEPYPLTAIEYNQLNYSELLDVDPGLLLKIHDSAMEVKCEISPNFNLTKYQTFLQDFTTDFKFDIVYFDAFAPNKQASPWIYSNLEKVYSYLKPGGLLVTYCAQGQFKRDLKKLGFTVSNPRGPMGKWEITLAYKIGN